MYTVPFVTAKIIDIGFVSVYYFIFGLLFAAMFDIVLGKFDETEYNKKSTSIILLEILLQFFLIGILVYVMRNIIERIPSPVEGIGGFQHVRLKEIGGGVIGVTILLRFQKNLQDKMTYCRKRFIRLETKYFAKSSYKQSDNFFSN